MTQASSYFDDGKVTFMDFVNAVFNAGRHDTWEDNDTIERMDDETSALEDFHSKSYKYPASTRGAFLKTVPKSVSIASDDLKGVGKKQIDESEQKHVEDDLNGDGGKKTHEEGVEVEQRVSYDSNEDQLLVIISDPANDDASEVTLPRSLKQLEAKQDAKQELEQRSGRSRRDKYAVEGKKPPLPTKKVRKNRVSAVASAVADRFKRQDSTQKDEETISLSAIERVIRSKSAAIGATGLASKNVPKVESIADTTKKPVKEVVPSGKQRHSNVKNKIAAFESGTEVKERQGRIKIPDVFKWSSPIGPISGTKVEENRDYFLSSNRKRDKPPQITVLDASEDEEEEESFQYSSAENRKSMVLQQDGFLEQRGEHTMQRGSSSLEIRGLTDDENANEAQRESPDCYAAYRAAVKDISRKEYRLWPAPEELVKDFSGKESRLRKTTPDKLTRESREDVDLVHDPLVVGGATKEKAQSRTDRDTAESHEFPSDNSLVDTQNEHKHTWERDIITNKYAQIRKEKTSTFAVGTSKSVPRSASAAHGTTILLTPGSLSL